MKPGCIKPRDLAKALIRLGGKAENKGGEILIKFKVKVITKDDTSFRTVTIIIGRKDFSRVMLRKRVDPQLISVGIHPSELYKLLGWN